MSGAGGRPLPGMRSARPPFTSQLRMVWPDVPNWAPSALAPCRRGVAVNQALPTSGPEAQVEASGDIARTWRRRVRRRLGRSRALATRQVAGQLHDPANQVGRQRTRAVIDILDGAHQILIQDALQQIALCSGAQSLDQVLVLGIGREDDDAHVGMRGAQAARDLQAIHAGHANVQQDDVGLQRLDLLSASAPSARLADEGKVASSASRLCRPWRTTK